MIASKISKFVVKNIPHFFWKLDTVFAFSLSLRNIYYEIKSKEEFIRF